MLKRRLKKRRKNPRVLRKRRWILVRTRTLSYHRNPNCRLIWAVYRLISTLLVSLTPPGLLSILTFCLTLALGRASPFLMLSVVLLYQFLAAREVQLRLPSIVSFWPSLPFHKIFPLTSNLLQVSDFLGLILVIFEFPFRA